MQIWVPRYTAVILIRILAVASAYSFVASLTTPQTASQPCISDSTCDSYRSPIPWCSGRTWDTLHTRRHLETLPYDTTLQLGIPTCNRGHWVCLPSYRALVSTRQKNDIVGGDVRILVRHDSVYYLPTFMFSSSNHHITTIISGRSYRKPEENYGQFSVFREAA